MALAREHRVKINLGQVFGLGQGFMRTVLVLREHGETLLGELAQTRPRYRKRNGIELFRVQCRDPNRYRKRAFCIAPIVEYSQLYTS